VNNHSQLPNPTGLLSTRTITGLILAGGGSRRFNGQEKGLIEFNGEPMVSRVAGVMGGQVEHLIISANRNHPQYRAYADQVVSDWIGNQWGPLAGLYTGLLHCKTDWLLVATCDQPLLPADYASHFIQNCDGSSILIGADDDRQHPLNMLIPISARVNLRQYLIAGGRAVRHWLRQTPYKTITFEPLILNSCNSVSELQAAEKCFNGD